MRDWTEHVRQSLDLGDLRWERAERIVRELAEHLEALRLPRRGAQSDRERLCDDGASREVEASRRGLTVQLESAGGEGGLAPNLRDRDQVTPSGEE